MRAKVEQGVIPAGRRVLAVSDIHGNLPFLRALLQGVGFCQEDILILVGDLVEKGRESLATLRYVMELSRTHTVYAVCGNCDDLAANFLDETDFIDQGFFSRYFSAWQEKCLLIQMGQEVGVRVERPEDLPALRRAIQANFGPEITYLRTLPTLLETEHFLFVHGGIPREEALESLDRWDCMKNDAFLEHAPAFRRWLVVGHWPVTLYHPKRAVARPILDKIRHIASIDGGCSLKLDGQLNALELPTSGETGFLNYSYDGLPTAIALEAQAPSQDSINLRWNESQVEVLKWGEEFSRCLHPKSGRVLELLSDYLYEKNGVTRCEDATDYKLHVVPGDRLTIVRRTSQGILAKKEGITGWYQGRLGEEFKPEVLKLWL